MQLQNLPTNKEIIILGHKNPDVDSIVSAYLMQKLLRHHGFNAKFIIPDKNVSEESAEICQKYGINPKDYMGDVPIGASLLLVDHYKTIMDGKVVGILDHHPTIEKIECANYTNIASSSTAMLVYHLDRAAFDNADKKKVCLANSIDTGGFSSTKTVARDVAWTKQACVLHGFDYDEIYADGLCFTNLINLEKTSMHGEKIYTYNEKRIKSSYIQCEHVSKTIVDAIVKILQQKRKEENLYMWVFIVHDFDVTNSDNSKSNAYLITNSGCGVIKYDRIVSRGGTIMPNIEKRVVDADVNKKK